MKNMRPFFLLMTFFWSLTFSAKAGNNLSELRTKVKGELNLGVAAKRVEANLSFQYLPTEVGKSKISLYLTNDVVIEELKGNAVKSYTFDKDNKKMPFGTLTVEFENPLEKGKITEFTISYSGSSTKGFFTDQYNWIDIDPDFMILPAFTDLHSFDYNVKARIDDPNYLFIDAGNEGMSPSLNARATSANYFASIVAGSQMTFRRIKEGENSVNIISNKSDSIIQYLGNKSLEILEFFNNTAGEKKKVNNFSILYRPMPDSVFRTVRNLTNDRLIMFTNNHNRISTLAHEISHFWWNRGNDFTMEKWLNESFAQYSELMYVRHSEGKEKFQLEINHLEKVSQELPSILKSDRFGKNWSSILYSKGPYLLYQLEETLGQGKFIQLLSSLNEAEISSTENMLNVLENLSGKEIRDLFYQKLNE